jgi:hypothetical protein
MQPGFVPSTKQRKAIPMDITIKDDLPGLTLQKNASKWQKSASHFCQRPFQLMMTPGKFEQPRKVTSTKHCIIKTCLVLWRHAALIFAPKEIPLATIYPHRKPDEDL